MEIPSAAETPDTPKSPSLFCTIRFYLAAFVAVALAAYVALTFGLVWLVVFGFAAGISYGGWLVLKMGAPPRIPFDERADLPSDLELPPGTEERPGNATLPKDNPARAKIMDELVWGKSDPAAMEAATAIAGPGGNVIERYIELRVAQIVGSTIGRPAPEEKAIPANDLPQCPA